jgi:hypothetical protein
MVDQNAWDLSLSRYKVLRKHYMGVRETAREEAAEKERAIVAARVEKREQARAKHRQQPIKKALAPISEAEAAPAAAPPPSTPAEPETARERELQGILEERLAELKKLNAELSVPESTLAGS